MPVTFRPATPDDLEALFALSGRRHQERSIEMTETAEDVRLDWFESKTFDPATMSVLAVTDDGSLAGFVAWEIHHGELHSEGYVVPEARGTGLGSALLDRACGYASDHSASRLWAWAPDELKDAHELFASRSMTHERSFMTMVHRSPATVAEGALPPGLELRRFDGEDARRYAAEGWNMSFIDHWNFHPEEPGGFEDRAKHPEEDTSLWFFAFEGDVLAGFCLNSVRKGEKVTRGHLGPIGTARTHRGIGLGRALLRLSVRAMAERGADEIALGVDSENPSGAVRLYESDGFEVVRGGRVFKLELAEAAAGSD